MISWDFFKLFHGHNRTLKPVIILRLGYFEVELLSKTLTQVSIPILSYDYESIDLMVNGSSFHGLDLLFFVGGGHHLLIEDFIETLYYILWPFH